MKKKLEFLKKIMNLFKIWRISLCDSHKHIIIMFDNYNYHTIKIKILSRF